ncbi:SIMPL domain-containing protein [archaeon]|jgi:uncharacterized protein|nr:SIMPL domain-containing protein [archaeon]
MKKQNDAIVVTAIIAGVILIVALVALLTLKPVSIQTNTVNVQGVAEVKAMPDLVGVYFNIETNGETSADAKRENDEIFNELLTSLVILGFERKDIVTDNFNVYPDYIWEDGTRTENGYKATHRVSVKLSIDESALISDVLDAGVESGAGISYINFELTQESQNLYKAEAMKLAAKDAKIKAESVAEGFDKEVGKLVSVQVNNFGYYPWLAYDVAESGVVGAKAAVANIQPGEEEIRATVSAVYKLR